MPDLNARVVRRSLRALLLTPALLVPLVAAPAFAVPPDSWPDASPVTALDYLMLLLVIPLGIGLVITVLVMVPGMIGSQRKSPNEAWRNENEWFGGPKDGVGAAESSDKAGSDRGGASGRW